MNSIACHGHVLVQIYVPCLKAQLEAAQVMLAIVIHLDIRLGIAVLDRLEYCSSQK